MAKLALDDYPGRFGLVNELHARPFPELTAPCRALHLAIMEPENAAERDRDRDRAHLTALLDRYGTPHPPPGASHYSGAIGRGFLKWELHTEFVTYTLFADGVAAIAIRGRHVRALPRRLARSRAGAGADLGAGAHRERRARGARGRVEREFPGGSCPRASRSAASSTTRR